MRMRAQFRHVDKQDIVDMYSHIQGVSENMQQLITSTKIVF